MTSGLVSIIIPTYNSCDRIKIAIDSVFNQSYKNWEVIIIDNSSTDCTLDMCLPYVDEKFRILKTNNNGVIAKSRNIGITSAKGEYIAFLDSDDSWKSDKLEKSVAALMNGFDLTYHSVIVNRKKAKPYISKVKVEYIGQRQPRKDFFYDLLNNGNHIVLSSVVVSKSALEKIGGFSEELTLAGAEDFDLWLRLSKNQTKFHSLNEHLGYYYIGENNFSGIEKTHTFIESLKKKYAEDLAKMVALPWWISFHYFEKSLLQIVSVDATRKLRARFFMVLISALPLQFKKLLFARENIVRFLVQICRN